MAEEAWNLFISFFANPTARGIGIALIFGAIWLAAFAPPLRRLKLRIPLHIASIVSVFITSAILTTAAIAFIQYPLQTWANQAVTHFFGIEAFHGYSMLAALIPYILLTGLVQEGAKLLAPLVYFRLRRPQDTRTALAIGAIAGAGFGIFEAQWVLNSVFTMGWNWSWVEAFGFQAIFGFWERFFAIAFHTAATAIVAYGLFTGRGWQFYLLAAFLHALLNYGAVLWQVQLLTPLQLEIYITVVALAVAVAALWLRWRPQKE